VSWDGYGSGEAWVELGRADGVLGEVVLRRRQTPAGPLVDLVCAGVMVMDDHDTTSERELATAALAVLEGDELEVVVGGLGLGFTLATALADPRVASATVVEVEPAVVGWVRDGLVPATAGVLDDPRVRVVVGDVAQVLPRLPEGSADVVLLDVDNGPGFLVAPANGGLYSPAALAVAGQRLRPGGVLAVWSAQEAPELAAALERSVGPVRVQRSCVHREGRELRYWVHLARRSSVGTGTAQEGAAPVS
jgi:spermidine synthase